MKTPAPQAQSLARIPATGPDPAGPSAPTGNADASRRLPEAHRPIVPSATSRAPVSSEEGNTSKFIAEPQVGSGQATRPYQIRAAEVDGQLRAEVHGPDTFLVQVPIRTPDEELSLTDEEISALNDAFKELNDPQLEAALDELYDAVHHMHHVHDHIAADPLVLKGLTRRAEEEGEHAVDAAHRKTDKAYRLATTAESVGHVIAPTALTGLAAALKTATAHMRLAETLSHGAYLLAEGLHAGVAVMDTYVAAKGAFHGASGFSIGLHATRAALGFASLFYPPLAIGVIGLTLLKVGLETRTVRRAHEALNESVQRLGNDIIRLVNEHRNAATVKSAQLAP